jgi:hypothetical protein
VVHEVEGEYRELVVPVGDHGSLQAPEIRVAFAGREDEFAVEDRRLAVNGYQRVRQKH